MNDAGLLLSLLLGALLGVVFFAGLWWTVRWAVAARRPGLWFLASLLTRSAIVLAGFAVGCGDDWRRWLAALLGFSVARLLITRSTRSTRRQTNRAEPHRAS